MRTRFLQFLLPLAAVLALTPQTASAASPTIPFPVPSHPRLWITTNDLPRLRSWAAPTNPVYQAVRVLLTNTMVNYDTQYFPGGVQNASWPDFGDTQGYTGLLTEEDAFIFALFSLIDPDPTARGFYAQRAANLIRVPMTQAALGPLSGAPFRDPMFATYNRANASLETMPLAVDWIYSALGSNGLPVFSAADKLVIRNGFQSWAEACRNASTAGGDSPPLDVVNDPSQLCPNNAAYRMAANNYYLGHARMMTLMSLAIDPADDPPFNPTQPVSALRPTRCALTSPSPTAPLQSAGCIPAAHPRRRGPAVPAPRALHHRPVLLPIENSRVDAPRKPVREKRRAGILRS